MLLELQQAGDNDHVDVEQLEDGEDNDRTISDQVNNVTETKDDIKSVVLDT